MGYVLTDKSEYAFVGKQGDVLFTTKHVALCYDKEAMILHKHGTPNSVRSWYQSAHQKLSDAGFVKEAEDLVLVEWPFNVNDLNHLLDASGYLPQFLLKYNLS